MTLICDDRQKRRAILLSPIGSLLRISRRNVCIWTMWFVSCQSSADHWFAAYYRFPVTAIANNANALSSRFQTWNDVSEHRLGCHISLNILFNPLGTLITLAVSSGTAHRQRGDMSVTELINEHCCCLWCDRGSLAPCLTTERGPMR